MLGPGQVLGGIDVVARLRQIDEVDLVEMCVEEGPGTLVEDPDEWLDDPSRRDWLLRQLARIETEPSLLGASPHVLAVARR